MNWIKRYISSHNVRHPDTMGAAKAKAFLPHLAVNGNVATTRSGWPGNESQAACPGDRVG